RRHRARRVRSRAQSRGRGRGSQRARRIPRHELIMLAALALLAGLAQGPSADTVRIDVIARDAQGRPAETLAASDFELREDGAPQAVSGVQLVHNPRTVGIY